MKSKLISLLFVVASFILMGSSPVFADGRCTCKPMGNNNCEVTPATRGCFKHCEKKHNCSVTGMAAPGMVNPQQRNVEVLLRRICSQVMQLPPEMHRDFPRCMQ